MMQTRLQAGEVELGKPLAIVRSGTLTEKRRATSSRRSRQRQRMTWWTLGLGPAITSLRSSFICALVSFGDAPGALRATRPLTPPAL